MLSHPDADSVANAEGVVARAHDLVDLPDERQKKKRAEKPW